VQEWQLLHQHAELGAAIVEASPWLSDLAPAIRFHHEHWDGTGAPQGLIAEAIPLEARMIAVAEAYHSMISEQPYQAARSATEALKELERRANTQFDPSLLPVFSGHAGKPGDVGELFLGGYEARFAHPTCSQTTRYGSLRGLSMGRNGPRSSFGFMRSLSEGCPSLCGETMSRRSRDGRCPWAYQATACVSSGAQPFPVFPRGRSRFWSLVFPNTPLLSALAEGQIFQKQALLLEKTLSMCLI